LKPIKTIEDWDEYCKGSKAWAIRMTYEVLHSEAYRGLNYAPALKVLNWFYEKIRFEKNTNKRGKNRYKLIRDGEINFPYLEAGFRGLTNQKFRKALIELHRLGFIDVKKPGSAFKKGDVTIYTLSDRWKQYDPQNIKAIEFPRSVHWVNFGFGSKENS
jgi:hypothetical protein